MKPNTFKAAIFDLDGVVTRTAHLHAQAWKAMFDEYLERRSEASGDRLEPFDIDTDYKRFVDGKPRYDGVRSFLQSRGIDLPEGGPEDAPTMETVCGLGNRKNERFQELLQKKGPQTYSDAVEQIESWRRKGMKTALITSSRNGSAILQATGLTDHFDARIDGIESARLGIKGKPAPDIFLEAARRLNVAPQEAIVLEDAISGVEAGRAGDFGLVVGVARDGGETLGDYGADIVVSDLRTIDAALARDGETDAGAQRALDQLDDLLERLTEGRLALFLDYDGTLTPIVNRPEDAILSDEMRSLMLELADRTNLAVVSGRDLADVQDKVGLESIHYAGSHGYDISGPEGMRMQHEDARESLPDIGRAERELTEQLADVPGAHVERKHFAIAVHYREAAEKDIGRIESAVDEAVAKHGKLRKKGGKKIFELQPDVTWDKGRAVLWLLEQLDLTGSDVLPVYIGDDVTDEDAFEALHDRGIGIRVGPPEEATSAHYLLQDTEELEQLFEHLVKRLRVQPQETPRHREMHPWELAYRKWESEEQPLREALCALGNGHIVTRGAFEEMNAGGPHYPGTYVAGGYNRLETEISGRVIENEDLVNWPNWLPLTFRPEGGEWFDTDSVELLDFDYRLDVRCGVLTRSMEFRDREGREFSLVSRRIVHMAKPHLAAIEWTLRAINWSGNIEIRSGLDGSVVNDNVERYGKLNNKHLEVLDKGWVADDAMTLSVRSTQSHVRMTQAARTRVFDGDTPAPTHRENEEGEESIAQRLIVPCERQKELRVEKVVSIRTGYDSAISEPRIAATNDILRAGTFKDLFRSHHTKWRHLWTISDIELKGDVRTQLILRLHIFHLLQTTSTNTIDRDVGVPARGWHGEAYRGHIFWDELFIFPLLTLRIPDLARSLLMYRYRRLPEARHMAREEGYGGAMFPWQSGSDGREESQELHLNPNSGRWLPDTTHLQRHVNAAIAYNVWRYYQATGDNQFLAYYGAEIVLEICRFWSSIATYDAGHDRYVIRGVVGPDEFHTDDPNTDEPGLNNNAYTNVMAAWVLRCAGDVLNRLDEERKAKLIEELQLEDEEFERWDDISRKLLIPFHDDVISQFEGYERLEEFDWEGYTEKYGDIHRLDRILEAEEDDVNRYKASKQADVLMLFFLFSMGELKSIFGHMGYDFDEDLLSRSVAYYMKRTSHGSTLSAVVHSWVLAREDREKAWMFWQEALHSDIQDVQGGTTPEGIHLGAMAGTVDILHRGHTGLVVEGDTLWLNPHLPEELSEVKMRVRYRGHWLTVVIDQYEFTVSFDRGQLPAVKIGFMDEVVEMAQGESRTFHIPPK